MLRTTLLSSLPLLALLGSVKADETVFRTTTYDVIARIPVTEYVWTNDAGSLTSTQITGTATYVPADETESATITSSTQPPAILQTVLDFSSYPSDDYSSIYESAVLDPSAVVAATSESEPLLSAAAVTSAPSTSASPIPSGDYFSTGSSSTITTLEDGSSAVIEYVVLYTNVCSASDY